MYVRLGSTNRQAGPEILAELQRSMQNRTFNQLPCPDFSVSNGGLILFGLDDVRQRYFPDARVSCARFRGTDKSEFIDRIDIAGSVLNAIGHADYSLSGMRIQGNEVDGGMGKRV